jgi:AraC family cel operon transcriptional repressor
MDPGQLSRLSSMTLELSMGRQHLLNLECFLLRLLAMVTEAQSEAVIAMDYPDWLKTAIRSFLDEGNWTGGVNSLVQRSGKTTEHVNRTIREITGLTTTEFVNAIRLDRAAHMLRMTRQPIMTVAMDCGYENLGYFYRCFKKRFNITPRQYRLTAQAVAQ